MEITSLQKKLIILISICTMIMVSITFSLYRGIMVNPNQLEVQYKTLKSEKIAKSLNDLSILYFTDLQYGKFQNKERCDQLFDTIQHLAPDVVIFGGDVYDTTTKSDEASIELLSSYFASIDAPFGKFAVLGEKDEEKKEAVAQIFNQSEFEILQDANVKISNQNGKAIRLIGLSTKPNYEQALVSTSNKEYNVLVSHYPDSLTNETLAVASIDLAIAGHAHSTQITAPILGGYKEDKHAKKINRNNQNSLPFPYILSTGTGCTHINARLLATPEVYYFTLKNN